MAKQKVTTQLESVKLMANRLNYQGGFPQQNRMIKDKRWTLDRAVKYSYQAAEIRKIESGKKVPALINPDKLSMDYDNKILSVGYEYKFKQGQVFEWCNTGSMWIVYLQDLDELAYFKGKIRRCRYQARWQDENGEIHQIYMAIRGPVEDKISYIQKSKDSIDRPNYSLNIILPKNKATLEYFRRYAKFYLRGLDDGDQDTCWRVEAVDSISTVGILELSCVEYYSNIYEDNVEGGVAGELVFEKVEEDSWLDCNYIEGPNNIKPKVTYTFTYTGAEEPEWTFDKDYPISYEIDGNTISIKWLKTYSGQINLSCSGHDKSIIVDSLY